MRFCRYLVAALAGAAVLFVWYGLSQVFPWGPSAVNNFSATSGETYVASTTGLQQASPGTWTTQAFEEQLGNQVSTLATDGSFSWVISVPSSAYSLPRYFSIHALTQLCVAILLLVGHRILLPLPRRRRFVAILALGVTSTLGVYGGMMNWIGMPAAYGLGQCFNHVVGWCLAFAVVDLIAAPTTRALSRAALRTGVNQVGVDSGQDGRVRR
jgi:hypothetical protein